MIPATDPADRAATPLEWLARRPVLAAVLGVVPIAFSGILVRYADVEPATAAFFRCLYALPLLGLLASMERRAFGPRPASQVMLAWLAGIFFALDLELFHHTIRLVGAGLATVLGNTQVVFVAVLAWLVLREQLPLRTASAIPLVLVGVVLISGLVGVGAYGSDPLLGVVLGLGCGITYALFLLVLRRGNADLRRPAGPLFDATLSSTIAAAAIGLPLGELDLVPTFPSHAWLILLAVSSQAVGWLLISISLPRLPAALTSVILTLQPVGAVLLAMLLVAETPSPVQLLGAAFILAGLMLATIRRRTVAEPEIG